MACDVWCNSEWSSSRWQISSPEEERSCSSRKPDRHGAAASLTEAFFAAAIDCFTSNVSGGGCHWLPTTDFTDRYPWHKQSAHALCGTNKSEPCRPSLGKLNGRCLGEMDLSQLFFFLLSFGSRQYCPQFSCSNPVQIPIQINHRSQNDGNMGGGGGRWRINSDSSKEDPKKLKRPVNRLIFFFVYIWLLWLMLPTCLQFCLHILIDIQFRNFRIFQICLLSSQVPKRAKLVSFNVLSLLQSSRKSFLAV